MKQIDRTLLRIVVSLFSFVFLLSLIASPAFAGNYENALQGVTGVKAVFDVSQGSPKVSNVVFWAVKNVYEDETVKALAEKPKIAIVFHGPAVKLLSTNRAGLKEEEYAELDKFQGTLRQMKNDGVTLEVCLYAVKVMGVDPATIMPEVDGVGNGFISVVGYQQQGYAVVRIP